MARMGFSGGRGVTRPISPPLELTELVGAVCSETEVDGKITTHSEDVDAHHIPVWTYLETLTMSSDTTINSSVLSAHDLWLAIMELTIDAGAEAM